MSGSTVSKTTILRTLTDALSVLARRHYTDTYRTSPIGAPALEHGRRAPPRRLTSHRPAPHEPTDPRSTPCASSS